jgi:galacturan 1,4-alpha-galacturonidase
MFHFLQTLGLALGVSAVLVAANPLPTAAPDIKNAAALQKRASCTFTAASAASKSKASCATIVLDNIAVPSGVTLDLTDLTEGTHVRFFLSLRELLANPNQVIFEGETTWGYEEWSGPLFSVSGENIVVTGASGHSLNGDGSRCRYWERNTFPILESFKVFCPISTQKILIEHLLTPLLPRVGWKRLERRQNQAQILLRP